MQDVVDVQDVHSLGAFCSSSLTPSLERMEVEDWG